MHDPNSHWAICKNVTHQTYRKPKHSVGAAQDFLGLTEQFFSTRNGFLPPKKVKSSFLVPKKVKSSFLVPKKGKSTFLVPKKGKSAFLVPKKGKIPLFWSFLVSKNCLLVRPRKFSFGWNCSLNGILVPQKESLLSKGLFMLLDFF